MAAILFRGTPLRTAASIHNKIFFSSRIPKEDLLKSVKRFRQLAIKKLEKLNRAYEHADDLLVPHNVDKDDFFYWELTVDYGIRIYTMYLEWAEKSMTLLEERIKQDN